MKRKIGFDADEVLIATQSPFNEFFNLKKGTNFTYEDYISFDLSQIWNITHYEVYDLERLFHKSEFASKIERMDGAYEAVEYLSKEYDLEVVTGRGIDIEHHLINTLSRLFDGNHFSAIHHLGNGYANTLQLQKWEKCQERDVPLLIDDYHYHLIKAAEKGIHGILVTAPWNKNVTDLPNLVTRVRNLHEVVEVIEKKEKIIWPS